MPFGHRGQPVRAVGGRRADPRVVGKTAVLQGLHVRPVLRDPDADLIGSGAGILTWPARGKSGAATNAERGARIHVTGSVIWASGESGWRVLEVRVAADQSQKGQATEIGPAP